MLGQTARPLTHSTSIHRCGEVVGGWRVHAEGTSGLEVGLFFKVQAGADAASTRKNTEQTETVR